MHIYPRIYDNGAVSSQFPGPSSNIRSNNLGLTYRVKKNSCSEQNSTMQNVNMQQSNEESDDESDRFIDVLKAVKNPHDTIVQKQVDGDTVKILVVLLNGQQRLTTFDLPNPHNPCTIQDLLDLLTDLLFGEETCVSLVSDPTLGINYIVEGGADKDANCQETDESGRPDNTIAMPDSSSPNFNTADKNDNSSVTPNEAVKVVDGNLAVCPNCGIASHDFDRCSRCKSPLPENVKAILITPDTQSKEETSISGTTNTNVNSGIQIMTVYPPPPAKGGIEINTEDYVCLGEDQYLNDKIIDFYLKYLTVEMLSETDRNRTHVFSSYFYKRLNGPHAQTDESSVLLTPAARRHARVQTWTKNVNIFEKDFIIIPINEHAHWYLAIICYPGLIGEVALPSKAPNDSDTRKTGSKKAKPKDGKVQALTIGSATHTPVTTTITTDPVDEGSERDDEEVEMGSDDHTEKEKNEEQDSSQLGSSGSTSKDGDQEEMVKMPCILIFDSLASTNRSRVIAILRDYLSCEYAVKVGKKKTFSKDTIKGSSPKVPQQSNFSDCGLYLLHYVESFFKAPIGNYVLPIKTLKRWFEEIVVTRKREELAKLLVRLMNQTKGDKTISLPNVRFPTHDGKLRSKPETPPKLKATKIEPDGKTKILQTTVGTSQTTTSVDDKTHVVAVNTSGVPTTTENSDENPDVVTETVHQLVPSSPSPSSSSALSLDISEEELWDITPTSL